MARIIFHVGMGKTGTTTIQAALAKSADALTETGHHYFGQWLGEIGPEFDQFDGFQRFLQQSPEQLQRHAETLLAAIDRIEAATGAQTFILSNEQYLENLTRLADFFRVIASKASLWVVIFVRSPEQWLPSAYVQWGVVHKTNPGPVRSFATKARELMRQYEYVRQWKEMLGTAVTIRAHDDKSDVLQEFASTIGLSLRLDQNRRQMRPSVSETILRAACNSTLSETVLPEVYNTIRAKYMPAGVPVHLSQKISHIFDWSGIPEILAEHREIVSFIEHETGIDVGQNMPVPPAYDAAQLSDELLGAMISIVSGQAHEIRDLRTSVDMLKRELSDLRTELAAK
ncbi:hypothetical protein KTN05_07495 [Paracoccus sp. Z118]|uniref:sulfotransferase n=1 Tax=Paracoccus sp. Z118 TaxID=2851017 RepID=UPI001C2CAF1D|nr:sulfotransferase [Paracoccus sp. Z118]MBV0891696.1 hypothetical protein [Paracoccus sp. Z118]